MKIVLFLILLIVHYFLSIRAYKIYEGRRLALFYLAGLAVTGLLTLICSLVVANVSAANLRLCYGFFGAIAIVLVTNLYVLLLMKFVSVISKLCKNKMQNRDFPIVIETAIPLVDKFERWFFLWLRGIFFFSCIVFMGLCIFGGVAK